MTTETILSDERLIEMAANELQEHFDRLPNSIFLFARAIEQDVLQSEQVQSWKRDAERLDWLADPTNSIGNVQLPTACVERNPHSLRDAIEDAMENKS